MSEPAQSQLSTASRRRKPHTFEPMVVPGHTTFGTACSCEPSVEVVLDLHEADPPPTLIYWPAMTTGLEDCWIAYVSSPHLALQSSQIVLVSKESGEFIYFGSANDEV